MAETKLIDQVKDRCRVLGYSTKTSLNATEVGALVSRWLRNQSETCFETVERRRANALDGN